jgi:hypothetical protein
VMDTRDRMGLVTYQNSSSRIRCELYGFSWLGELGGVGAPPNKRDTFSHRLGVLPRQFRLVALRLALTERVNYATYFRS